MIHILSQILPIIENASPIIAGALGSPIAGIVINVLCKAFDANPGDVNDVVSKIASNENAKDIIKTVEQNHLPWLMSALSVSRLSNIKASIDVSWDTSK